MALINKPARPVPSGAGAGPHLPEELNSLVGTVNDPGALCDMVASAMSLSPDER